MKSQIDVLRTGFWLAWPSKLTYGIVALQTSRSDTTHTANLAACLPVPVAVSSNKPRPKEAALEWLL